MTQEEIRLAEDARREKNWKRWGPYLSERQWGTVREDYSADGTCWDYLPHDVARSRAYRWGEDGLLGITDRECRLCFALALWNGRDPILKERLFGLTNEEGNHGEDVKECYFYLDSTPTHSYMKALYKYPQSEFPYDQLVEVNRQRGRGEPEFELIDTGIFNDNRYFDVLAEYAKASPDDILIRVTVFNRGPETAVLHLLPTLWYRNTWIWGCKHDGCWVKPTMHLADEFSVVGEHVSFGKHVFVVGQTLGQTASAPQFLFTENETNSRRLFQLDNYTPYVKDAFHQYLIQGKSDAVNPKQTGTKVAAHYKFTLPANGQAVVKMRLTAASSSPSDESLPGNFDEIFAARIREAEEYRAAVVSADLNLQEKLIVRQAHAGILWSKQFYHYIVRDWLEGDPQQPSPPASRKRGRNSDWLHLYSRDVISMPDKWEYPWFAAWDLAFHMIVLAGLDPQFAKEQLVLLLREWYLHPNGELPAYEFAFDDVNPPVHAWSCWRVYKMTGARGQRDRIFLSRTFQKLVINFTWWVNRKDAGGNNIFGGGFLGLDNIGVFDRSQPLPNGGQLEQADGTAWMAFFCNTMLSMALELARDNPATEDMASKFFEHFVAIADAINTVGGSGLWDETDGFYYDQLKVKDETTPLRVRSLVGLLPLIAVEVLEEEIIEKLPGFRKRLQWFLEHRKDLGRSIAYMETETGNHGHRLLAIPSRERLERVLRYMLDENEFLSPFGIRSVSKFHEQHPFVIDIDGAEYRVDYSPGETTTGLFGGNSNWRGPVWFPSNYLLIEALERYHHFYGEALTVECPTGSGRRWNLQQVADELRRRLTSLFLPDGSGHRPCHGNDQRYATDPHWKDLILFYEHFHGDTGRGLGANHQTGWTALAALCIEDIAKRRRHPRRP
ncbi:MAG TPA: glucosidase [Verrucomicrobiae bacterium]|nr:glucosidase [Verrucomicrobiae bacterium]